MIRTFDELWAREACAHWLPGEEPALTLVGHSTNSVYRVKAGQGRGATQWVLRLTDPAYRSRAECESELAFLLHAQSCKAPVAVPLAHEEGGFSVLVTRDGVAAIASAFRIAPGGPVGPGAPGFGAALCEAWGRALSALHAAARTAPEAVALGRRRWDQDVFLTEGPRWLGAGDASARNELDLVLGHLDGLPRGPERFGLCHGDLGPQNFHWHPGQGLTCFDFGNLSRHWFTMDLAVAAGLLRPLSPTARRSAWTGLLRGYQQVAPLPPGWEDDFAWMLRLRALYVWLSRVWKFGPAPGEEERRTLAALRARVGRPVG